MATAGLATIGHDAAAALLQLAPEQLTRLVSAGAVRRAAPGKYIPAQIIRDYIAHLHAEPDRIERYPTQQEIAEHLDMSDRNLRDLLQSVGLDHKQAAMSEIRVAYIRRLREQAAGRMGGEMGGLDLVQERAALAREQREGQAIKNAVARREYAPVGLLADVLGMAASAVVDRFDQLEGALRKACPDLPEEAKTTVQQVIANARNEWLRGTAALVADGLDAMLAGQDEEGDGDGVVDFEESEGA
jgi:phage terminase Nu1 subunit (DNA packaging protein)